MPSITEQFENISFQDRTITIQQIKIQVEDIESISVRKYGLSDFPMIYSFAGLACVSALALGYIIGTSNGFVFSRTMGVSLILAGVSIVPYLWYLKQRYDMTYIQIVTSNMEFKIECDSQEQVRDILTFSNVHLSR